MYVDIHHHLIHGVDDGAAGFEATQRLIREAWADGIGDVITTPHMTPGREEFPHQRYLAHLQMARQWCAEQNIPLRLYVGAELMYTDQTPRLLLERQVPTLAGSRYVLLEFWPGETYARLEEAARKVGNAGYTPIFAHIERYECLKRIEQVQRLRDMYRVHMQVNGRTLLRKQGLLRRRWIDSLFENEAVDFIASDTHDMPGRHTCMKESEARLRERYGDAMAERLLYDNPALILQQR